MTEMVRISFVESPQLSSIAFHMGFQAVQCLVGWYRISFTEADETSVDDDEYRVDARQACLMAAKCCMNLHQSLHKYPTGFAGKTLTLHIGAGFGRVTILQVRKLTCGSFVYIHT